LKLRGEVVFQNFPQIHCNSLFKGLDYTDISLLSGLFNDNITTVNDKSDAMNGKLEWKEKIKA
jgi:hypothetical protein